MTRKGGRTLILIGGSGHHRIPEAFRAFCIIVSFTAANTSRIFVVSVACVRLRKDFEAVGQITDEHQTLRTHTVGKH